MFGVVKIQIDSTAISCHQRRAKIKASVKVRGYRLVRSGHVDAKEGQVEELVVRKVAYGVFIGRLGRHRQWILGGGSCVWYWEKREYYEEDVVYEWVEIQATGQ